MRTAQQLTICLWAVLSLMACSVDNDFIEPECQAIDIFAADTIEHTYPLQFECESPVYDDEVQTRATTTWSNGTTVYLRLYSTSYNSSTSSYWYPAKAVYNSGSWTITVTGSPSLTESSKCEAYYFVNPVTLSTSYVSLNHLTAIYKGTDDTSTYSHPSSSEWSVKTTLKPLTWRMRFRKATYNQSFTLPSGTSNNDLEFPSRFSIQSGDITWNSSNDISLSTNESNVGNYYYSKYIYGRFKNSTYSTSTNKLTVKYSDSESYYRNVAYNKLVAGESGYFTLPNSTNYSSLGWSKMAQTFNVTMPYTTFDAAGDYWWLEIDTDDSRSWTVTSDKSSWVHFSLTSNPPFSSASTSLTGSGKKTVYVVCSANNTTSTRTATITVSSNGLTPKTFTITQNAGSVKFDVVMEDNHRIFDPSGDWWWLDIDTDDTRSWTVTSDKSSWVHFSLTSNPPFSSSSTSLTGSGKKKVYVVCSANNTGSTRTATITVSSSGLTPKTFVISQESQASTAPFTITSVEIGNIDYDGNIINSPGTTIYSYQTQYLIPKLYLTVRTPGIYTIYFKLYMPNGSMSTGTSSPTGYTIDTSVELKSTTTSTYLYGWGSSTAGTWSSGQYHWEFWYNGQKIFDKYHTIY